MSVLKKLFTWKTESDYKTFDEPALPTAPVARVNLSDLEDENIAGSSDGRSKLNDSHPGLIVPLDLMFS